MIYPAPEMAAIASSASGFRQSIWLKVRELQRYTSAQLYASLPNINRETIREYNLCLYRAGFVTRENRGKKSIFEPHEYLLVNDIGYVAPRVNKKGEVLPESNQLRMWRAMRVLKTFTIIELVACANADPEAKPVTEIAAYDYLKHLRHAQYVTLAGDVYRLVKMTGGAAPMVQRTKVLFDPNIGKVICLENIQD